MNEKTVNLIMLQDNLDFATKLLIIGVFVWIITLAAAFLFKVVRPKKILGSEFDTSKEHSGSKK